MEDAHPTENEFLKQVTEVIEENISDEMFGVTELARKVGMSRSNLLRKIRKLTNMSVSQFIRQVRLINALELLEQSSYNVSEVSFRVGFSSPSYFIKCFREYYGYPPGEAGKRGAAGLEPGQNQPAPNKSNRFWQELKRRKVVRVITVYAAAAFVLLELTDIVAPSLGLPGWTLNLIIILLCVGFVISVILSWIYDVTPQGIEKTRPADRIEPGIATGSSLNWKIASYLSFVVIIALVVINIIPVGGRSKLNPELEKSIAVLPFKNDSNDSTNVYVINGLMESILGNLQHIEDLRVISRTSVEKYRNDTKTIREISRELQANYLVEGSGQKIGDQLLLNIQLIEAPTDKHLWAKRYRREATNIFELQLEVARNIVDEIEAIITPEEEERISKTPTDNPVAYDYFLKGLDHFYQGTREGLENAISLFELAIEHDGEFARAYANMAIAYAFLDMYQVEKRYTNQVNEYADKAILADPKLPQSLIAKAMEHISIEEYKMAVPYLEKALEYNPNSALVINILSDFYTRYIPDTEKYLEYALKGIGLDIAAHDSVEASIIYLHVGNAFMQLGFIDQAERYVSKSLDYNPESVYTRALQAYILFARTGELGQTKELLIETLRLDSNVVDIFQEIGNICYYMRDYEHAYVYYKKLYDIIDGQNLTMYEGEKAKFGVVCSNLGLEEEFERLFAEYKAYADNDNSIYKHLSLAVYYSFTGDPAQAVEHLALFSERKNYPYWYILFLEIDPLFDNIKDLPEFQRILQEMKYDFWNTHAKIRSSLEEKGLI